MRHLIDLGHKDIALLHGDDETDLNFDVPRVRIKAFQDVMAGAGLHVRPEWDEWGDFTVRSGQDAFRRLWARPGPKPTAIFCASDEMAMGVIFEATRLGVRVPEDLSVIGIDDHDFSDAMGLTTVRPAPGRAGRTRHENAAGRAGRRRRGGPLRGGPARADCPENDGAAPSTGAAAR